MKESFVIRYEYRPEDGLNLTLLGESFAGFDSLLKDILETANLGEEVEIKTTRVQQGSIEVFNALVTLHPIPFTDVQAFLEFLRIAAPELLNDANTFFSNIHGIHRTVNDYFARNPVDMAVAGLIIGYITGAIRTSAKLKNGNKLPNDSKVSPRQISRLKRIVESGRYRRALAPITEGVISTIEIKPTINTSEGVKITERNVGEYLPEDDKILPDLHNGDRIKLSGELLSLQSTRGDVLKIKVDDLDPRFSLLTCTVADGASIESYKHLFKERVVFEAEVVRASYYKRPELVVYAMSQQQEELGIE
ncbi:MAG TPA: hypothetical protein VLA77_01325 [Candidatus Saccharimonadales bacterium]|nr:hypothetical protein [Candidatus Saccharimonadales bacterium]